MNLLEETIKDITISGHSPQDIDFIGSDDGEYQCTWEEFKTLADKEYDAGFGAQEVAFDIIIVFKDGGRMWRHEYDGSEHWKYSLPFGGAQEETKSISSVFSSYSGWDSLASIHGDSNE